MRMCPFQAKIDPFAPNKTFLGKKLFSSTHCPIFLKKIEWIQSCQDVAYLCPKWSTCPYVNCFRKSQISINEISCNWVDPHYISIKGLATGVEKNKQIYDVVYRSISTGFTISISFKSLFGYAWPQPCKLTLSIYNFNRYKTACTKSYLYLF